MSDGRDLAAPLIATLGFDPGTFARLDALRRRYFPPERNLVPAHVSLFHALPPEEEEAIVAAVAGKVASIGPIPLRFAALQRLGRGMAVQVNAPGLAAVHRSLAETFRPWLTPQDRQPFRPHVTIMNKADRADVELAYHQLGAAWEPFEGAGTAVLLWAYRGGPWDPVAEFRFGGGSGTTTGGASSA